MSPALYAVRLFWNGRFGTAKYGGVTVDLMAWPSQAIPGVPVVEVDFAPEVRACTIRESANGWREMTAAERAHATSWLARMAGAVGQYLEQPKPTPSHGTSEH